MVQKVIYEFVTLFVILDAVGMLAIFLAVTAGVESRQRRKLAILGILCSYLVLVFFIAPGNSCLSRWVFHCAHSKSPGGYCCFCTEST